MNHTLSALLLLAAAGSATADSIDVQRLDRLDAVVTAAVERGDCPGAVVVVVHDDAVVYRKAFGSLRVKPDKQPLPLDAVFDLASLTKPMATATSLFALVERGKLRLTDKVAVHWPAFAANGKEDVTVEQLLLHTSGLIADNAVVDYAAGKDKALETIAGLKLQQPPGRKFEYSDVGFIVLGHLVERISGSPLDEFAAKTVFAPLKMNDTAYKPAVKLKERCVPTTERGGKPIVGDVHDPRTWRWAARPATPACSARPTTSPAIAACCSAAANSTASASSVRAPCGRSRRPCRCPAAAGRAAGTATRPIRRRAASCSRPATATATRASPARPSGWIRRATRPSSC